MRNRRKKLVSLLVAAAMVFTMNSFALAEEAAVDGFDEAVEADSVEDVLEAYEAEASDVDFVDESDVEDAVVSSENDNTVTPNAISADLVLSENLAEIKANIEGVKVVEAGEYFIVFSKAVQFNGMKIPKIEAFVYKKVNSTASGGDLVSENGEIKHDAKKYAFFKSLEVKKISTRKFKGATVKLDGSPLYEAKKATYIKGIKLKDKTENKAFQTTVKDKFKAAKKSTEKVSANGLVDGKEPSSALFSVAVYPCYVGNDEIASYEAAFTAHLVPGFVNTEKSNWDKAIIKITMHYGKKLTLKLTKKEGKYKGIDKAGKQTCNADSNSLGATSYYIADGNYAGNIYF